MPQIASEFQVGPETKTQSKDQQSGNGEVQMTVDINFASPDENSLTLDDKDLPRELLVQFYDFAVARYGVNSEQARISMCLADGAKT